jgi:CRISPR-associated endonuclease Csn1
MNAMEISPDLELAFDVGHSSIGWAVLQRAAATPPATPSADDPALSVNLLGCGAVIFRADDCLASDRRTYRRQRRHIRSTRQRIKRLKLLLGHLGSLTPPQLDQPGCAWPWQLAARVLQGGRLLTWPELWDVLRWYAHNRGYDGNRRWSGAGAAASDNSDSDDAALDNILNDASATEDEKDDAKKVKEAKSIMRKFGVRTMAETFCAVCGIDPLGDKRSCNLPGEKRPKGMNAAFPRATVEGEVRRILQAHFGKLPQVNADLERSLLGRDNRDALAWQAIPHPGLKLPNRYQGGLLFGQLVPRFDNRIIAQCPITFAEEYQRLTGEGYSEAEAKDKAGVLAKVPGKYCTEFLNFRWAMTLASIRIGHSSETYRDRDGKMVKLRSLTADERCKVDARARRLGFLKVEADKPGKDGLVREGKNELRQIVTEETKCDRHNLDTLLLDPNARDGLELVPADGSAAAFRLAWACFDNPGHDANGSYRDSTLRHRFFVQLLRQKKLSLNRMIQQLDKTGGSAVASRIREAARKEVADRRGNVNEEKLDKLMAAEFFCPKLRGRACFSRAKLRQAFQEVFRREKPIHPQETGGCLAQTEDVKQATMVKDLAEQTNNHLVRHRLLILAGSERAKPQRKEGLLQHIVQEFAGGDQRRIARITIELARDLQAMSGMKVKDKAQALSAKLAHHQKVSADLAEKLRDANGNPLRDANGRPFAASPGMIRKARILADLEGKCPYTGRDIEFVHLANPHPQLGTADKDHVVPRSLRLSDALEAQVITFSEVNRLKGQRTALQFIRDMNLPENNHNKDRFGIKTEAQFRRDVDALWPKSDPFRRARAGGSKPTDDEARCWRRKQLLLKVAWEGNEFTPADLANTRYVVKLAKQQLEASFFGLPKEARPPVIAVTGAVTASFREKSWRLWGELAAVNPAVRAVLAEGMNEWDAGKNFNPKKAVREISHLHHAVDSVALALVTHLLVPLKHQSLDGTLARFVVKGKLSVDKEKAIDEVAAFRALCARLGLPRFARLDSQNRLHIAELPESLKAQIRQRLAEKRVVQHIPADTSGLACDDTVYRVLDPHDPSPNARRLRRWFEGILLAGQVKKLKELPDPKDPTKPLVVLVARKRRNPSGAETGKTLHDTGKEWRWIYLVAAKSSLHGLEPAAGHEGKLAALKGVKLLGENFGVAAITKAGEKPTFEIIRPRKVWKQVDSLRSAQPGAKIRLIRKGALVELQEADGQRTRLRIFGCGERPGRGIYFDAGVPDAIDREREIPVSAFANGRAKLVPVSLTGAAACPSTSSTLMPPTVR